MKRLIPILAIVALIVGCSSFSTNCFRTEQAAVSLAYGSYLGYTQALASGTLKLTPDQSNAVKKARLDFAATVGTVEALRVQYATNSTVKAPLEAALQTMLDQSSNVTWLIQFVKGQ